MEIDSLTERLGYAEREIIRHRAGLASNATDCVMEEVPVALVFNGISHAVMMATPRDLEEFAVGFALTEGIVDSESDIFDTEVHAHDASAEVHLRIAQEAFLNLKGKRRALAGRTGCGVCGIESIELLDLDPEPLDETGSRLYVTDEMVARAAKQLPDHQTLQHITGGVHAAAWCDRTGTVTKVFEDVGRHNGLDKLIGHLALTETDVSDGFVFLSSRASYELARKAARFNIGTLATISAPTTLAIEIARKAGLRLLSFCRADGFVEYT